MGGKHCSANPTTAPDKSVPAAASALFASLRSSPRPTTIEASRFIDFSPKPNL
jgi:hypothetical protein